ncbi:unnamed protein product [Rotaria sordida]|uniref:G-protein coupled receptors family 1 profile domain-containing protein n=1 Tax=Rotaria sordida TaxID=392033 RepID=A0A819JWD6_9BILA|nr:unnamed protein product [Rotaria sordida]CAF3935910.1 unnamed protein product [Rotaria sordida]
MSTSPMSMFTIISQQVTIYLGLFILIIGFFGGLLNIIIFLSLQTFRQNSCAFYLTAMSFANIIHLTINLLSHIIITGYEINLTAKSIIYCKIQFFLVELFLLTSLTCMCLATLDQFLATCSNPFWHRWNNIKLARYVLIGTILFWLLHGIPTIIYFDIIVSPSNMNQYVCLITNTIFQQYITYGFVFILMGLLPLIIMVLFGSLAYYNVRNLAYRTVPLVRRELDKQLTKMVLVQVIYNIFVLTPFVIVALIAFNLPTIDQISAVRVLAIDIHNFYFASPFYIYICVSKRFRQQFIHVFCNIHFNLYKKTNINNNQIQPKPPNTSINHISK